ncbi:MAG: hypothetical protein SFT94_10065 [Pseudanabaenaceae cyanobacterium bins.68]|nr:hypothetical protein [Pseudanabaenaceae cyanobacterium bins.68]
MPPDSTQPERLNTASQPDHIRTVKVRRRDRYSTILLSSMSVIALISGVIAFWFGQATLEGVRQIPADGRLPRLNVNDSKPVKNIQ